MAEIKLYKSPLKSLKLFVIASAFVILGIWLLLKADDSRIISIMTILFFGLGLLIGLFNLLDRRPQIIINKQGIWDRTTNQDIISWEFIHEVISPIDIYGQIFIPLVVDEKFIRRKKMYNWSLRMGKVLGARDINLNISLININIEKFITMLDILRTEDLSKRDIVIEMYKDRIT